MPRIYGMKQTEYGTRVDVALYDHRTTENVFWSPRWESPGGGRGGMNSYVLVREATGGCSCPGDVFPTKDGPVSLASINGMGEIRWTVSPRALSFAVEMEAAGTLRPEGGAHEELLAARHFGLVPSGSLLGAPKSAMMIARGLRDGMVFEELPAPRSNRLAHNPDEWVPPAVEEWVEFITGDGPDLPRILA